MTRLQLLPPLICLLVANSLFAQQPASGEFAGTVRDTSKAVLPRATVTLFETTGERRAVTLTNGAGEFRFRGLAPGRYALAADLEGFRAARVEGVSPGQTVDLVLELPPVRERIVVTPTRTQAPTSQLASAVSVFSAEEMRARDAWTVTDLLRTAPGVAVAQSGPHGALTSLFVRGGESDFNKVLLDGIPLNEPGGAFNFANLTTDNLDRVEFVRGPESALFGSDAIASVVQLFTARGHSQGRIPHVSLLGEGGTHALWRPGLTLSGLVRHFDYALHFSREDTTNATVNSFFRNTTLSSSAGTRIGASGQLRFVLRGESGALGTPDEVAFRPPDTDAFFLRRDGVVGVSFQDRPLSFWEQTISYSYARSRQRSRNLFSNPEPLTARFDDRTATIFDFTSDFFNDTSRHRFDYQANFTAPAHHIFTFAFDYEREAGRIGDFLFPPFVQAHRNNFGWVAQDQWLAAGRLFITAGVRVDRNDSFGTAASPRYAMSYLARGGGRTLGATRLKFNFGLGIKEPKFVESFSPSFFFHGNPTLKPERSRSFEVGVEQKFWADRARFELDWFDNRFRDLIGFRVLDFTTFEGAFFNVGKSKAKGAEANFTVVPRAGLRATISYTFLDSQVIRSTAPDDPVFAVGRPLLRRPKNSGTATIFWDRGPWNLNAVATYVGARADSDFLGLGLLRNSGYTKLDFGGSYHSARHVTYFAVLENALNRSYMEVLGFPALKLTVRAGVRVELGNE